MAIDVKSDPGRMLNTLATRLADPERLRRLNLLDAWSRGKAEMVGVHPNAAKVVREFHELADTGLADLIAEAVRERRRIRGIRTAADDDATGDSEAWKLWLKMRGPLVSADVHRMEARFGTAYAMVSEPPDDEPGVPIITAEDPRSCIADLDPLRFWVARWGLKMLHDPTNAVSRAYLMRPGRVDVAYLETKSKTGARFSASSWNWDETLSMDLKPGLMPLVPFEALDALGEFEKHMRLLRRIDFMILQQLSIAVLQAFKQRGIKGVPAKDDKGQLIDYDDIFSADPGALWLLPAAAEIWESGQVDLSGILTAVRDYIRQLAAASRTPLSMMEASGENQSAEGAASAKEGLVFKVEDRNLRGGVSWARVIDTAGRWIDRPYQDVQVDWAPPARSSLIERATAIAAAKNGDVPFRTRMIEFGEFDPAEVDRMEIEREDDLVFAARVASMKAAMTPKPAVTPEPAQSAAQPSAGGPNGAPATDGTPQPATGAQSAA